MDKQISKNTKLKILPYTSEGAWRCAGPEGEIFIRTFKEPLTSERALWILENAKRSLLEGNLKSD